MYVLRNRIVPTSDHVVRKKKILSSIVKDKTVAQNISVKEKTKKKTKKIDLCEKTEIEKK